MKGSLRQRKPPFLWERPEGRAAALLHFNGTNQWVDLAGNPNLAFTGDYTVSFFCSLSVLKTNVVVGNVKIGGNMPGMIYVHLSAFGAFRHVPIFRIASNGTQTNRLVSYQDNKAGQLYHIVLARSGSSYLMYLNSVQVMPKVDVTLDAFSVANNPWSVGRPLSWAGGLWVLNNGWWLNGNVGHLSFYNRALTAGEIELLHRFRGIVPVSARPDCVAYYPMEPSAHDPANLKTLDRVDGINGRTAFHGSLVNYQAASLADGTAYRDFYTLQNL